MLDKQSQHVGEEGTAVQAGRDAIVVQGISYESARQIALDVYQANFPILVSQAAELARARAEELTDKFLKQLHKENPAGLAQATTPAFQNALLHAQREHACAGDTSLADLLVDLLVDRTKHESRELQQLVLDEALKTAPKLTDQQIAVLAATFLLKYVRSLSGTWEGVVEYQKKHLAPVLAQAKVTPSTFSHLEFTGCGTINTLVHSDLTEVFYQTYAGCFHDGFTDAELSQANLPPEGMKFILPHEDGRKKVAFMNEQVIDEFRGRGDFDVDTAEKLKALLRNHRKPADFVRERMLADMPFYKRAHELWNDDRLSQFTLTSVGMAIGHAFVKKTIKAEFAPLSIWIR